MAYSDRELLARLIECEAGGEGENGMKAVASVVMNRVTASGGEYARVGQGSIRKIIMQPGQFVCASETERGAYNPQNIYNMRPTGKKKLCKYFRKKLSCQIVFNVPVGVKSDFSNDDTPEFTLFLR